jgi:hypothetical protein
MTHRLKPLLALLLPPLILASASAAGSESWRFKVFLDRSPIGEHVFERDSGGDSARVSSRARFDVRFLIFDAYSYRHASDEVWRGACLERIRASTDDNGDESLVEGERKPADFMLAVNGRTERLPSCVSTFAYWDRAFLERRQLLNPQTGELVAARVEAQGVEQVQVGGRKVTAERYRLVADGVDITLWYTPDGDWVGLASDTGQGKTLRYERL